MLPLPFAVSGLLMTQEHMSNIIAILLLLCFLLLLSRRRLPRLECLVRYLLYLEVIAIVLA